MIRMTVYTPFQRAYFRELSEWYRGGGVKLGDARVIHKGASVPLESIPDAELAVRVLVRKPPFRGGLLFDGRDLARVYVRHPDEPAPPLQLREIAAVVRRVLGDRKLGVRDSGEHVPDKPRARIFEIGAFALPDEPPLDLGAELGGDGPAAPAPEPEPEPVRAIGRADFDERRQARIERLEDAAARKRSEAAASFQRIETIAAVIPMGQPILVGHHSEKRHRRDLKRIDAGMRRGVAAQREAAELESAARAAERNGAIRADDPEAIVRLRDKLRALEAEREQIKATNAAARKGDPVALEVVRERCRHTADDPRRGFPAYMLTNLGAEIRRCKERLGQLLREASRPERAPIELGGWSVTENRETNRVELRTPGGRRSTEAEYREIKAEGFRWARTAGAFVRLLNDSAWRAAQRLVERFGRSADTAAE
jgi:hypothetical protein